MPVYNLSSKILLGASPIKETWVGAGEDFCTTTLMVSIEEEGSCGGLHWRPFCICFRWSCDLHPWEDECDMLCLQIHSWWPVLKCLKRYPGYSIPGQQPKAFTLLGAPFPVEVHSTVLYAWGSLFWWWLGPDFHLSRHSAILTQSLFLHFEVFSRPGFWLSLTRFPLDSQRVVVKYDLLSVGKEGHRAASSAIVHLTVLPLGGSLIGI